MSKGVHSDSVAEAVRRFAEAQGVIRVAQVREQLGLDPEQTQAAVRELNRQGNLRRIDRGVYAFQAKPANAGAVVERIWRAMRINERFTAADIALQASTTPAYAARIIRRARAEALVAQAGRKNTHGSGSAPVWRLTEEGRQRQGAPEASPFRPDPLVRAAVELNKLVCTGQIRRFADARSRALALCDNLKTGLEALKG